METDKKVAVHEVRNFLHRGDRAADNTWQFPHWGAEARVGAVVDEAPEDGLLKALRNAGTGLQHLCLCQFAFGNVRWVRGVTTVR